MQIRDNVSKERIEKVNNELNKIIGLKVIRKDFIAPLPPPPPFGLSLYKDKIVYKGKQIKVPQIEEKAKEFLVDAKKNYSKVSVYYDIPEEKLNLVTDALKKAGIKRIDISEIR